MSQQMKNTVKQKKEFKVYSKIKKSNLKMTNMFNNGIKNHFIKLKIFFISKK